MFDLSTVTKAIAGGIISVVVAELARYGFNPSGDTLTALGVIVTAVVSYVVGHIFVYMAPANKAPRQ